MAKIKIPTLDYIGKSLSDLRKDSESNKLGLLGNLILSKVESEGVLRTKQNLKEEPLVTDVQQKEAEGIRDAIVKFLTDPRLYWTISKLKASLEIESFETSGPLNTTLDTKVTGAVVPGGSSPGGLLPGAIGIGMVNEPLVLRKDGAKHGGRMKGVGHAYVGEDDPVPNSDTTDPENEFTTVHLHYEKILKELIK